MIIQDESHQARNSVCVCGAGGKQPTEAQKYDACEWLLLLPKDIEYHLTSEGKFQNRRGLRKSGLRKTQECQNIFMIKNYSKSQEEMHAVRSSSTL